jgi:hypothetical protein
MLGAFLFTTSSVAFRGSLLCTLPSAFKEAAALLGPKLTQAARALLQRSFNHAALLKVCDKFLIQNLPTSLSKMVGALVSPDLRSVALAFKQLQEARHIADYDLNATWNRARSQRDVQVAREPFSRWALVRRQSDANIFLLSFLLLDTLEHPRK